MIETGASKNDLPAIGHKRHGVVTGALADAIGRDQLGLRINRHERPLVAQAAAVVTLLKVHLLLADIGPDFVNLDPLAGQVPHLLIGERSTAGPDLDHKAHDRIPVSIGHPLGGADRIALDQAADDLGTAGERGAVHGTFLNRLYAV